MEVSFKNKIVIPENVADILRTLSRADFFSQGLLVGSWVMLLYKEIFKIHYTLRTFDLDFALETITPVSGNVVDLEKIFIDLGYIVVTDYQSGFRKFTREGLEVEFLVHRKGGRDVPKVEIKHLNVSALPLPHVDILFLFPIVIDFGDYKIRIPSPEALFLHKLIIAQKRKSEAKKENDLAQCKTLTGTLDFSKITQILKSLKLSGKSRRSMANSCKAIDFPPQKLLF
ncbi:MAG: hypothetical protein HY892_17575 [Deltaproteobacteria bacterium]|nr:hypothetical protein [Deltaproteobacteria bacterium]